MIKRNIVLYVRVSTQEQAKEGYSIDEQLARLKKYCEAHGWRVVKEYVDPGYSGANTDRPGLKALIEDCKQGSFDTVLVYKLDRLSRSQKDTLYLIEDVFLASGVDFVSMTENFDTSTPFGKAMIGILSVFAQLEREQIKERMIMGKDARAKQGKFHGSSQVPIGYRYIDGELVVDPYEAHIVKQIFNDFANGHSRNKIVADLKEAGLQSSYGSICKSTIYTMLRNVTYTGMIKNKDNVYEGAHEAIVSKELFDKVQEILRRNRENPRYQNLFVSNTLLGSLMKCKKCNQNFRIIYGAKNKDGYRKAYYADAGRKLGICDSKFIRRDKIDKEVLDEVRKLALDPDRFIADRIDSDKRNEELTSRIESIKAQIKVIDAQSSKLIDLYSVNKIDFTIVNNKLEELKDNKDKLSNTLDKVIKEQEKQRDKMSVEQVKEICNDLPDILDQATNEELRQILRSLIDVIYVYNGDIEIHWKFL